MRKNIFEVCAGSVQDCINAQLGGADRVELNSALSLGGLTPSVASLRQVKAKTNIQTICMVRPRAAGFCYDEIEKETIFSDAEILLENGADGLAFGFLHSNAEIDGQATVEMVRLIHSFGKEAVFHRAFDCVKDPFAATELLISCGVDRILTSGLQPTALMGANLIAQLQKKYGDHIQLLAGSGVNADNIRQLKQMTNVHQFHSSCKIWAKDPTTTVGNVSYAFHEKYDYDIVGLEAVRNIAMKLEGM